MFLAIIIFNLFNNLNSKPFWIFVKTKMMNSKNIFHSPFNSYSIYQGCQYYRTTLEKAMLVQWYCSHAFESNNLFVAFSRGGRYDQNLISWYDAFYFMVTIYITIYLFLLCFMISKFLIQKCYNSSHQCENKSNSLKTTKQSTIK